MINCVVNISKEEIGLLKQNKARIVDEDNCFEYNEQELRRLDAICKWIKVNKDYELRIDSSNKNRQAIMALPWDSSFDAKSAYFANDIHFVVDSQETAPTIPGGGQFPSHPMEHNRSPNLLHTRAELTESGTPITMLPNMRSLKY